MCDEAGSADKPTLVLVHAYATGRALWADVLSRLGKHWHVLAPDLPGYAPDGPPVPADVSLDAYADALVALLDSRGISKAVFLGCSMGGYTLFRLWERAPDRVAGLAFCDTAAHADSDAKRASRLAAVAKMREAQSTQPIMGMTHKVLGATTLATRPDLVAHVDSLIERTPWQAAVHGHEAMAARPDSTKLLASISVPVLSLRGSEDALSSADAHDVIAAGAARSERVSLPTAGHLPMLELPVFFATATRSWLQRFFPAGW